MVGSKREMLDYGTSSSGPDGGRCWHTTSVSDQCLVELSHHDNKDRVRFTNQA